MAGLLQPFLEAGLTLSPKMLRMLVQETDAEMEKLSQQGALCMVLEQETKEQAARKGAQWVL